MPPKIKTFNGKRYEYVRTVTSLQQTRIYLDMQRKIGLLARKVSAGAGTGKYHIYTRKR